LSPRPDGTDKGKGDQEVKRLSPSMVVALVALLVALSGGAIAASTLVPRNSVGSAQIINHSVKKVDLGTPLPRGPRGPQGAQGDQGAQGAQGVQGPPGIIGTTHVYFADFVVPAGDVSVHAVECPAGTGILSGGVSSVTDGDTWYDAPSGNGWAGAADNFNGLVDGSVRIFEVCGVGAPTPSSATFSTTKMEAAFRAVKMAEGK
jgi:hypothetical protein